MRLYHERLRAPLVWWLVGLVTITILATELVAGLGWPAVAGIYLVLVGGVAAMLVNWGRARVEVADGELRAGPARLPLSAAGEVTPLDEAQTRSLRGPRGDPAAFLLIRPYLRRAVYVQVSHPPAVPEPAAGGRKRRGWLPWRRRARAQPPPAAAAPYWLVCTRHPEELAAAIVQARPSARVDGATMG